MKHIIILRILFFLVFCINCLPNSGKGNDEKPSIFDFAHSHNDYYNPRPLLDALENGFNSVEADIFLVDNEILVAHDLDKVSKTRSLTGLYLDPLEAIISSSGSEFINQRKTFWLMIDIKSNGSATYKVLHSLLKDYKHILTDYSKLGKAEGAGFNPVSIVISGNRDRELIAQLEPKIAAYDGRLADLRRPFNSDSPSEPYMAWVSDNWANHFTWNGVGPFSESESIKLRGIVEATHKLGAELRFWNTPDIPEVWKTLKNYDVDLINTDRLASFRLFFSNN